MVNVVLPVNSSKLSLPLATGNDIELFPITRYAVEVPTSCFPLGKVSHRIARCLLARFVIEMTIHSLHEWKSGKEESPETSYVVQMLNTVLLHSYKNDIPASIINTRFIDRSLLERSYPDKTENGTRPQLKNR